MAMLSPVASQFTSARSLFCVLACAALVACGGGGGGGATDSTSTGTSTGSTSSSSSGGSSGSSGSAAAPPTGTITLSWTAPQTRADGTPLTDLAGYRIYYGTSSGLYTQSVTVNSASATTYTLANLAAGTYYLTMKSFDTSNIESAGTAEASKTIN
jgi:hypothetical protein